VWFVYASLAPAALLALLLPLWNFCIFRPDFRVESLARERTKTTTKLWSHIGQGWRRDGLVTSHKRPPEDELTRHRLASLKWERKQQRQFRSIAVELTVAGCLVCLAVSRFSLANDPVAAFLALVDAVRGCVRFAYVLAGAACIGCTLWSFTERSSFRPVFASKKFDRTSQRQRHLLGDIGQGIEKTGVLVIVMDRVGG